MSSLTLAAALLLAVDFEKQVAPILESACLACHGPGLAAGGLRLDTAASALKAIRPGQPDSSPLFTRTQFAPGKTGAMPPGGPALTLEQSQIVKTWIAEGASWPGGVVVSSRKPPKQPDDLALVEKLRAHIAAAPTAAEFKAYRQTIPGTDVSYEMAPIPVGEFTMSGRRVKLDEFWMAKTEVTWDEYRLFMFPKDPKDGMVDAISRPTRPYVEMSFGMGLNGFPAISMTQHAANKYAQWLSARTGHFYRLPTEAEWEYACRAGGDGVPAAQLAESAWFADNSSEKYQKVGAKKPNAWGLHDMQGNVMEWTLDAYAPLTPAAALLVNPWIPSANPYPHAVRGGGWLSDASQCLCTSRVGSDASWKMQDPQLPKSIWYLTDAQWLGFRLVRPRAVPPAAEMHKMWNNGVEKE